MEDFKGVIIEESLEDAFVLGKVKTVSTKVEPVTPEHKTPWVKQWTMHTVEIPAAQAAEVAKELSHALDSKHTWYADFKNDTHHYIVFRDKVFYVDRSSKQEYDEATKYGVSIGIPEYQVDFSPHIKEWKR